MNEKISRYIDEVMKYMVLDEKTHKRVETDLYNHISSAAESSDIDQVLEKMGPAEDVAREFMDSLYSDKVRMESLLKQKAYYEFKSKTRLFGLPLVHIKFTRSFMGFGIRKPAVAKGIIAIGNISIGVVSISAIPLGGLCIGALPLGILAFGGLAAGLLAVGGLAVGLLAIGGVAVGLGAIGGVAVGKIAVGGFAKGTVAIGGKAVGDYVINAPAAVHGQSLHSYTLGSVPDAQVEALIRKAYPHISSWIVKIFTFFS